MSRKPGALGTKPISQMSMDELRAISDLDLTDKDLAEVIQAIHAGGAQSELMDELGSNTAEDSQSPPQQPASTPEYSPQRCTMCKQTSLVPCSECVLCQGPVSTETLQAIAEWLKWQHKYCEWMHQQHQHVIGNRT